MLLQNLASRITARKLAAERALKMLLKRFAHMHWDTSCFCLALTVYERAVWDAKAQVEQFQDHVPLETASSILTGQGDPSQRHAVLKTVETITRGWLELTVAQAPLLSGHILLHFMDREGAMMPSGCSYATNLVHEVLMNASHGSAALPNDGPARPKSMVRWRHWGCWAVHGGLDLTSFSMGIRKKAKYMGMAQHAMDQSRALPGVLCAAVKRLKDLYMNTHADGAQVLGTLQGFADLLGTVAGLVFLSNGGYPDANVATAVDEALHAIAHAPFHMFSFENMKEATTIWAWLHVSCTPRVRRLLARNICAAWDESQDRGVGLFSSAVAPSSASECGAHALCVEYLQEVVRVTSRSADTVLPCVEACLQRSLADPSRLLLCFESLDACIQMLRLSVAVVSDDGVPLHHAALLFDRLLCAGLLLFLEAPSWRNESRHAHAGSRPGVTRHAGAWVVVPTWTGIGCMCVWHVCVCGMCLCAYA
jgi:hypothetical protein